MATKSKSKAKRAPEIIDPKLAKALSHPLRVSILAQLAQRNTISPTEFCREFGDDLNSVAYHFRELEKLDCIELAHTEQRRGANEHFYRSTKRPLLGDAEWARLPKSVQGSMTATALRDFFERAAEAVEAGTFDSRDNSHFSWTPFVVDEEGWNELVAILESAMAQTVEVQVKASARMAKSQESGISATVALAGFESPKS